jgi:hypothetical protein
MRDARLGHNGEIAYVDAADIHAGTDDRPRFAYESAVSTRPWEGDDVRTLYLVRSAYWSISDLDEVVESNHRSLLRDHSGMLIEVSVAYGTRLALDVTDIDTDEDVAYLADELRNLDDRHPLYDEQDYSELQHERQSAYLRVDGVHDYRRETGDDDTPDDVIARALSDAVWSHENFGGDWDGTGFTEWDVIVAMARASLTTSA